MRGERSGPPQGHQITGLLIIYPIKPGISEGAYHVLGATWEALGLVRRAQREEETAGRYERRRVVSRSAF